MDKKQIKQTINLPKTGFSMRANLQQLEPKLLGQWTKDDLYGRIRKARAGQPKYLLHDGPPYASGEVHIGTGMNKILKDIVVKYKTMQGFDAPFIPGWDCHGLPIEHRVLEAMRAKSETWPLTKIRHRCKAFASKHVTGHRKQFKSLGILGRWERPYLTLTPAYEAGVLEVFKQLVAGNYVYRKNKPIHWCGYDQTALAEAELEYKDRDDPSIFAALHLNDLEALTRQTGITNLPETVSLLIWTTTPWTLFGNVAVTVHPEATYKLMAFTLGADRHCAFVAAELAGKLADPLSATEIEERGLCLGQDLAGLLYRRPFPDVGDDPDGKVVCADYVTMSDGSGLVHTAPGHGDEDYRCGLVNKLPVISPVDGAGRLIGVGAPFDGLFVLDANALVIDNLRERGMLCHTMTIHHSYPHCWRCRNPLIFRATAQWFIGIDHANLREQAKRIVRDEVKWYPQWGQARIEGMLETRPDWCISRQRSWGIPIPAFYCDGCGDPLLTPESVAHIQNQVAKDGSMVWFERSTDELLGTGFSCASCDGKRFRKENDIFDVWFESGSSWNAVLQDPDNTEVSAPADLYLEGTDQHRGWFQLSLLPSVAVTGKAPYKEVLTHGFVVDERGHKMSKSIGNYISLEDALAKFSADIIRLWFASVDYTNDVPVSANLIDGMRDAYRKIRNTFKYLLGNVHDLPGPLSPEQPPQALAIDRWILARLQLLQAEVDAAYNAFKFYRVHRLIHDFCTVELSSIYFEVVRDRLYCERANDPRRRACQWTLATIVTTVVRALAPILAFTTEEVWQQLSGLAERWGWAHADSVHLAPWPLADATAESTDLESWDEVLRVREDILREVELLRKAGDIGSATEVCIRLQVPGSLRPLLDGFGAASLASLCVAADLEFVDDLATANCGVNFPELRIHCERSANGKCARCWIRRPLGNDDLCTRCETVVREVLIGQQ